MSIARAIAIISSTETAVLTSARCASIFCKVTENRADNGRHGRIFCLLPARSHNLIYKDDGILANICTFANRETTLFIV